MINVEEIKKEIEVLMQKISLQYDALSNKEKKDLLFIADRFNHGMVALTIFDDKNEKSN